MSDWIKWSGGKCPVEDGSLITKVKLRDGDNSFPALAAKFYDWRHDTCEYPREWDIVAYKVIEQ